MDVRDNRGKPLPMDLDDAWVISDTHFLHDNIVSYEPIRQTLPGDHTRVMVQRWRETVPQDGVVLHLGDLALGKADDFAAIAAQLTGARKYLLRGNHDPRSHRWYGEHGFNVIPELWLTHNGWKVHATHRPDGRAVQYPRHLSLHGHVHSHTLADRRFINCAVEDTDFRPRKLSAVLDERIAELANGR